MVNHFLTVLQPVQKKLQCDPTVGDGDVNGKEECDGGEWCTDACVYVKIDDCEKFTNQESCESGNAKELCMWVEEDDMNPVLVSDPDLQESPLRKPERDGYCTDKIVCGNGIVEEGEQCDDGEEGSELCDEQCNYKPTSGVQGRKFHDLDKNGKYSEGDLWLDEWMITIYTPERQVVKTMTTNDDTTEAGKVAAGQFRFVNLYPGTYHICEEARAAWMQTRPVAGFVDPNTNLYCNTIELAPGELKKWVIFGNFLVEEGDVCVETLTTVDALIHTTTMH
jgi:hypothetical protein